MAVSWDDHRYFLTIAREGTLTAAGKSLGVSQPTVSRRLEGMESKLKVRLFDRTRHGYQLTAVGMDLFETVQQVEEDLAEADRKIYGKDQELAGALRITCTEILLNGYLGPFVWQFLEEHPAIELSILCTRNHLSLSRNDADLALRFTAHPPETLTGRRLTSIMFGVYAASGPRGGRFDQANRAQWDWIGIADDTYSEMMLGASASEDRIKHRVDSMEAMHSMVRCGLGVAVLPCYVADRDETLRRVEGEKLLNLGLDLWILRHADSGKIFRVRQFAGFVATAVKADQDLFEGRQPQLG